MKTDLIWVMCDIYVCCIIIYLSETYKDAYFLMFDAMLVYQT